MRPCQGETRDNERAHPRPKRARPDLLERSKAVDRNVLGHVIDGKAKRKESESEKKSSIDSGRDDLHDDMVGSSVRIHAVGSRSSPDTGAVVCGYEATPR